MEIQNKYTKNKHWRMVIDPINNNEFSNWFVKHKTVYGNAKKIVICCLIISFIQTTLSCFVYFIWRKPQEVTEAIVGLYVIYMVIVLLMGRKILKFINKTSTNKRSTRCAGCAG